MQKAYQTVVQRYFTKFYEINVMGKPQEDQCVLQHSNKICMITVAPSHKLFQDGEITGISFQVNNRKNRADNKVSGKGKKGGQQLEDNSLLCQVELSNGNKYLLRSCIHGKLVEINQALLENPKLLLETPEKGGYIAIVLPKLKPLQDTCPKLLNEDQYQKGLEQRK